MTDHRSYVDNLNSCEIKPEKHSGLNGIRTHDFCDTGAVHYQLSYQATGSWPLVLVSSQYIPVEDEEYMGSNPVQA